MVSRSVPFAPAARQPGGRSRSTGVRHLALAGSALLLLGACGSGDGGSADGERKVTLISCVNSNPWCAGFNKGLEEGLGKEGVKVTTQTSNFDAAESSRQFNQALSQKPDAILYYVNDPMAAVADYRAAQKAGVPVIVVDTVLGDEADGLIELALQPDHAALGKYAAENLQEGLKAEGVDSGNIVAITGTATQNTTKVRMEAFKEQLATTPEYKLVEEQDGNWDPAVSGDIAAQLFAKYGKDGIQGIYGMADYQAASIAQAAEQAGVSLYPANTPGVVITGSNCAPTGVEAMRAKKLYGGATQAPAQEAEQYVPYILQVLDGEDVGSDGPVSVPVERVTYETVEDFADICVY
jgi:ABC-type sugar transport system substrate-binding protein